MLEIELIISDSMGIVDIGVGVGVGVGDVRSGGLSWGIGALLPRNAPTPLLNGVGDGESRLPIEHRDGCVHARHARQQTSLLSSHLDFE